MIIRIFGEGQYELPEQALAQLNELDADAESAVSAGDEQRFHDAYDRLLEHIRNEGTPLADDLRPSDLLLPPADSSVVEVARELQARELIPG